MALLIRRGSTALSLLLTSNNNNSPTTTHVPHGVEPMIERVHNPGMGENQNSTLLAATLFLDKKINKNRKKNS